MQKYSSISKQTIRVIYPYVIIFGLYIILRGPISPGGGFQGGAILSSIYIVHYLVSDDLNISLKLFTILEKILYFLLVVIGIVCVFYLNDIMPMIPKHIYLVMMNLLIGLEVFCGFSVIFFRFIYFESR